MWEKLEEVERRFEALTAKMSDPTVASRAGEFRDIARERASLEPLVEALREYRSVEQQLADSRALLESEKDPEMRALAKEEVEGLEARSEALEKDIEILLLPKDPNDEKNVILEIRAGTGGEEAALFAGDLLRMYLRYAERKRWKFDLMERSESERGGIKEAVLRIEGQDVFSHLKYESGVHRVQRVPETEAQGRIHTSAASVAVLPEAEDVDIRIDPQDLRVDVFRASGPGGQSVNTTDSAVRLTHLPTGIVVSMQDEKSQHKNKAKAMMILRARIYEAEQEKLAEERAAMRRAQGTQGETLQSVRAGTRADKIRTYNFPQDRLTDHRIGLTRHNLDAVLDGDLEDLVTACRTYFQAEALKAEQAS